MKTIIPIAATFLFLSVIPVCGAQKRPVDPENSKDHYLFVFKAEKKFVGATIEIYSSDGELVTFQHIYKRKMIIDFQPVMEDTYTIRIVKGELVEQFEFVKK